MSVKVKRERPSRRQHHRVTAPLLVTIGGHTVRVSDWSLGGLRVDDFPGKLPVKNRKIELHLSLPFQGFEISFSVQSKVVRTDPKSGMFAVQFVDLDERERELMEHFVSEIIRGSMVEVEDTIQRIDVPVTPVSTEPDPNPEREMPSWRRPMRTLFFSAFYIVVGFFVFSYVGLMLYANFYRLEVQSAVISAPIETVRAQFDGRISWTAFRPGDPVRKGDIILRVEDNLLEKTIDLARVEIGEREARLAYLRQRHAEEQRRMESLANIERKNVAQVKLDVERLEAEFKAAEARYRRLAKLHSDGFATKSNLEAAEKEMIGAKKRLERARVELSSRTALAKANQSRWHYNGSNFVGEIARLEAEIAYAKRAIALARKKYEALLRHRKRLAVRAPFDGIILELPRADQSAIKEGETIALIEKAGERHVLAYLRQSEILKVGLGDEALGYLPALGETLKLEVAKIDRTRGFIDEQHSRYSWRGSKDRTAQVLLKFTDEKLARGKSARHRPGLPVVVIFKRRSTNQLLDEIRRRLGVLMATAALEDKGVVRRLSIGLESVKPYTTTLLPPTEAALAKLREVSLRMASATVPAAFWLNHCRCLTFSGTLSHFKKYVLSLARAGVAVSRYVFEPMSHLRRPRPPAQDDLVPEPLS